MYFDVSQLTRLRQDFKEHVRDFTRVSDRVGELERTIERLELACRAMWELARKSSGLREDELLAKMEELDLRNGKADGRLKGRPKKCPSCTRANHQQRARCLYCGEILPAATGFDAL